MLTTQDRIDAALQTVTARYGGTYCDTLATVEEFEAAMARAELRHAAHVGRALDDLFAPNVNG